MIREIIKRDRVKGDIKIPSSKSHGQRALACSLISRNKTLILGLGVSNDEQAILDLIIDAGAEVTIGNEEVRVSGKGYNPKESLELSCNESGLGARMLTPILANSSSAVKLIGKRSILNRTMHLFDAVFDKLDVDFHSNEGKLPFSMKGPLIPKSIVIDGSISSQFATGIILGYVASPLLRNEVIEIKNPTSVPYIELTLDVLSSFGVHLKLVDNKIRFSGPYELKPTVIKVEGDWSSASFFLVVGAILGDVTIRGLNLKSKQADVKILEALRDFGAEIILNNESVRIIKAKHNAFEFDATHCPDLFPPLAVLASFGDGVSRIKGVSRLVHKESNRAQSILSELNKMGANITLEDDEMVIEGVKKMNGSNIDPHGDHRIAMAASIMGLTAQGKTIINNAEVVNKSFPDFFECLNKLN
jgi:3-phosphoshikimate 1-carboxyvinyltransferase